MANKKVWVHSANWEKNLIIDDDIFDDVLVEACTQAITENIKNKNMTVSPFMEVRLNKKGSRVYIYNTYKVLINAGYYTHAENLRYNFRTQTHIDLKTEPMRG